MKKLITLFLFLAGMMAWAKNTSRIFFDLNYDTDQALPFVTVQTGCMAPASAKPYPAREGYRFGGWYISPECRPEQEWRFGSNASFYTQPTDSMKVERSMILYAKWVSPLSSPWGIGMSYKIENCKYKTR